MKRRQKLLLIYKQVPKNTKICQQKIVKPAARNVENNLHEEGTKPQDKNPSGLETDPLKLFTHLKYVT